MTAGGGDDLTGGQPRDDFAIVADGDSQVDVAANEAILLADENEAALRIAQLGSRSFAAQNAVDPFEMEARSQPSCTARAVIDTSQDGSPSAYAPCQ